MSNKSKNKGNNGERELCKILTNFFNETFTRVPNSGAFVGGINTARMMKLSKTQTKIYKGDIITPDTLPKMVLESKAYSDFSFHSLYSDNYKQLDKWIEQTLEVCDPTDVWFVCFKINRKGWFICFDKTIMNKFNLNNYTLYNNYVITELNSFFEKNVDSIREACQ